MFSIQTLILSVVLYLVFAPLAAGLLEGGFNKLSGKLQGRPGSPILKPFDDLFQLLKKEENTADQVQEFFLFGFLLFLMIAGGLFFAGGDLLMVIFTLTLAKVFLVMGLYTSQSRVVQKGGERELLLMMTYEPVILLAAVGFYLVNSSFDIADILHGALPDVVLMPGMFLGFVLILTMKQRSFPYELSGKAQAMEKLAHWYERILLLGLLSLFFAWDWAFSPVVAVSVSLVIDFLPLLIDRCFPGMKRLFAIQAPWIMAMTAGFANLIFLYLTVY